MGLQRHEQNTAFAWRDATDHISAVSNRLFRMERPGFTGHALRDDFGVFVN